MFGFKREREHIDRMPPGRSLLLVELGCNGALVGGGCGYENNRK